MMEKNLQDLENVYFTFGKRHAIARMGEIMHTNRLSMEEGEKLSEEFLARLALDKLGTKQKFQSTLSGGEVEGYHV